MASWADGLSWDAVELRASAQDSANRARDLDSSMARIRSANPEDWSGLASRAAGTRRNKIADQGVSTAELLANAAEAYSDAASKLQSLQADMRATQNYATGRTFRITGTGSVVDLATGWARLDPRRPVWRLRVWSQVQSLSFRLTAFDIGFAGRLSVLAVRGQLTSWKTSISDSVLSGAQYIGDRIDAGMDWTKARWEELGDLIGAARGTVGEHLGAFRTGLDRLWDASKERPRWLDDLFGKGQLPSASEVAATGLYLTGLGAGAVANLVTGQDQRFFDDGTPFVGEVIHNRSLDNRSITNPADLMRDMWDVYSTRDQPGAERPSVQVTVVENPGQPPRYVVAIPGTTESINTWDGWTGHQGGTDWSANFKGVGYGTTSSTQAIMEAIDEVTANHPGGRPEIILTGHSQGGIIAANMASDPVFAARYDIGGIMTAGSPIQSAPIPHNIPVINFDNSWDPVPKLDLGGFGSTATQPNVVEVDMRNGQGERGLFDWHGQETYANKISEIMQPGQSQWVDDETPVHDFSSTIERFYTDPGGNIRTYQVEVGRETPRP